MYPFITIFLLMFGVPTAPGQPHQGSVCQTRTVAHGTLPDPACTPGAVNPNVTQANIATTICQVGWTATIRPPVAYTNRVKTAQMRLYGETGNPRTYSEDHRVPLETGGAPTDPRNLWPQPHDAPGAPGSATKDRIENYVHAHICSGQMALATGQAVFLGDYVAWAADHHV